MAATLVKLGHDRFGARGLLLALGAVSLAWVAVAWGISGYLTERRTQTRLSEGQARLEQHLLGTSAGVTTNLKLLHGIPAALGRSADIHQALKHFDEKAENAIQDEGQRQRRWTGNPELRRVDQLLQQATTDLQALSVLWVMNLAGDCIAASNFTKADSFVGTHYRDREYFREARAGHFGEQFAVGRKTGVPGLFFSAPVEANGRLIGVIAGKVDLAILDNWISQSESFLADRFGVIILAKTKALEFQALPNASVLQLSPTERAARYRKSEFQNLATRATPS